MGHKAMVAYEVSSGVYNLHFSPWGADNLKLKDEITQNTPFGGEYEEPSYIGQTVADIEDSKTSAGGHATDRNPTTKVNREPKLRSATLEECASQFNYLTVEAFFVVKQNGEIESYLPVPYLDGHTPETGLLVKCDSAGQYSRWFTETRKPDSQFKKTGTTSEWESVTKEKFGNRIAEFSKYHTN